MDELTPWRLAEGEIPCQYTESEYKCGKHILCVPLERKVRKKTICALETQYR